MFSFFKKKKTQPTIAIPDWCSFFTAKEYSAFIKAVENYLNRLSVQYEINDGAILPSGNNVFGAEKLGLGNLSQMCKQNDIESYENIVVDHFDAIIRIHQFNEEFDKMVSNFNEIEKYIGVRLYDQQYCSFIEYKDSIISDFTEGIIAMLVFDLPESIMNIKQSQIELWGKTVDELFELGKNNIKKNYKITLTEEKIENHTIWFAEADHFFATNFAFDISDYPQLIGKRGSLVSIPNRHTVIIYPIHNLDVLGAINHVLNLTSRIHENGPGSITDKLYWFHDGIFTDLPHRIENEKLIFSPPQEFVDILNKLGEEAN